MVTLSTLLQVAAGGALGSAARLLVNAGASRLLGAGFPFGTLIVNVAGSFLMGLLVALLAERTGARWMPFLATGLLGGFTTFSAFSLDALKLWEGGEAVLAGIYVAASVSLSLAAVAAGLALGRALA